MSELTEFGDRCKYCESRAKNPLDVDYVCTKRHRMCEIAMSCWREWEDCDDYEPVE